MLQSLLGSPKAVQSANLLPQDLSSLPLAFGTTLFTFEGFALLLPIENEMENRQAFHGWTGLLSISMGFMTILYSTVGTLGYLSFGDKTK